VAIHLKQKYDPSGKRGKFDRVYLYLHYPGWELEPGALRFANGRMTLRVRRPKPQRKKK
jgi:hypothetical protein